MITPEEPATHRYSVIAAVAGLIAVVAALATAFLPVDEQSASFSWPANSPAFQGPASQPSVVAPLVTQTARGLRVSVGCPVLRQAAAGNTDTVVVATAPSNAPREVRNTALFITAGHGGAKVTLRNAVLASADAPALAACSTLEFWASDTDLGAQFAGAGAAVRGDPATRPTVAGVFTDLDGAAVARSADQLAVHVDVDNGFAVSRTPLKTAVIVIGVVAALISLLALGLLDAAARRSSPNRRRRFGFGRLPTLRAADAVVTATLVVWHFLGAGTSDDGYIAVMGRNASDAGYLSDYYRYFGVPEAPFDWYYSFLSHWGTISAAGIWMRLPALVAGLVSWLILSRVILPRLGAAVGRSRWAVLTGAAVFVAFWIAFCSGLRPEPIIVLGSLVTWWLVESAIATRRLLPAAAAAFTALLTLATGPQGVIAVAVLIAGSRPMLRIARASRRTHGSIARFAPFGAAVALAVFVVFRTQSVGGVVDSLRVRLEVGPALSWYQELMRYYFLTLGTPDGALARRVPVLLLIVAVALTMTLMMRRGRLSGFARGPIWRLIGTVLITVALLSFVPAKWTIQFGIFAGVAAAAAAVATAAMIEVGARSPRILWTYLTVLVGACAVAAAGDNAWGWGYDYGIAWFDKAPVLAGRPLSTLLLGLTGVSFAVLIWVCVRPGGHRPSEAVVRRRRALAALPALLIAAGLVLAEFALFGKAAVGRTDTYTPLSANLRALTGSTCGMADRVLVERNPNRGMLRPIGTDDVAKALAGRSTGFTADGVATDLTPEPIRLGAGTIRTAHPGSSYAAKGAPAGTTGGYGRTTVNGSRAALPFGLDPATTPVLGSYGFDNGTATLTSDWFALPARDASPLIVITAAGSIFSIGPDGAPTGGRELKVEFGADRGGAFVPVGEPMIPIDPGPDHPNRPWRNLRIPMADVPAGATAMRITAVDANLNPDEWLAITPPRAPRLSTLQQVVGSHAPVLLDLSVGSQFPCQQPVTAHDGVYTVPEWRITPDRATTFSKSKSWQAASAGGILAVPESLTTASTVATYLENDWYRDWGTLLELDPLVPGAKPAALTTTTTRRPGWHLPSTILTGDLDD